jgi:hypothetical protein
MTTSSFTPLKDNTGRLVRGWTRVYLEPGHTEWVSREEIRNTGKSATQIARTR